MIKLFDQYNPYYTKINYHQLIEFMDYDANINNFNNKIISFTQDELNKLQSLIPNLIFKLYKRTTSTDPLIRFQHEESKNTLDGYIHKFDDEDNWKKIGAEIKKYIEYWNELNSEDDDE